MSVVMSSGVSTSVSPTWGRPGGDPGSLEAQAMRSSGAIAAYLNQNGIDSVDPNQLFAIANNTWADVPAEVQQAAGFMLSHPEVYAAIETSDRVSEDGVSSVRNFEQAAQGNIALVPSQDPPCPSTGAADPSPTSQAETASGALDRYMQANGLASVDTNRLYALSRNPGGDVPADVQDAATFMLKNPGAYRAIETSDVAGADGISGASNFDQAAQGKTFRPALGSTPVGAAGHRPSSAAAIATLVKLLIRLLPAAAPGATTVASTPTSRATLKQRAEAAAGTLGSYLHGNDVQSVDLAQLKAIARNTGGSIPVRVQQAAGFMLMHPGIYAQIETDDVAGADGISGVGNFDRAAQGQIAFR